MPSSKNGRSLQDCLTSLGASVKRRKSTEESLSATKRHRILDELLPVVVMANHPIAIEGTDGGTAAETSSDDKNESESSQQDNDIMEYLKYAREQKDLIKQDMDRIEEKRRTFYSKQSDLIGVYTYGLDKISKLTDVRDAPDAILPGNQV